MAYKQRSARSPSENSLRGVIISSRRLLRGTWCAAVKVHCMTTNRHSPPYRQITYVVGTAAPLFLPFFFAGLTPSTLFSSPATLAALFLGLAFALTFSLPSALSL